MYSNKFSLYILLTNYLKLRKDFIMISIIVPTLGYRIDELKRLIRSLEKQEKESFQLIVVSQDNHKSVSEILEKSKINKKHVKINKKGLSIARNEGLKYVNSNIVTFGDDDCWYPENIFKDIEKIILDEGIEIGCFNILDPIINKSYKNYKKEKKERIKELEIFKVSSIEIFINLNKVSKNSVKFDQEFGIGAKYKTGEENILLNELFKEGYKLSYIPKIVVYHPKKQSTNSLTEKLSFCKGAAFKRMFPNFKGLLYINLLIIKHRKKTDKFLKCLISANKGFYRFRNS